MSGPGTPSYRLTLPEGELLDTPGADTVKLKEFCPSLPYGTDELGKGEEMTVVVGA